MTQVEQIAAGLTLSHFLTMVDDFGNMSTGAFIRKYPDCGSLEGYSYIQRKGRQLRKDAHLKQEDQL